MTIFDRPIRWHDYITINIYWFALGTSNGILTPLIIPLLVQGFVGESVKGTYVGTIRLWGLMTAVLVQSLMGALSDRSTSRFGRRRPFIFGGTIGQVVMFILVGLIAGLDGLDGFWALFIVYLALMVASNSAQAASQSLIPDLVPDEKKGIFSGVKALLEIPLPLIFISFVVAGLISAGKIWEALIAAVVILVICSLVTMFVREEAIKRPPFDLDWRPFARVVLMVAVFTATIIISGELVTRTIGFFGGLKSNIDLFYIASIAICGMIAALGVGAWSSIRIALGSDISAEHRAYIWWVINRLAFLTAATNLVTFLLFYVQERFIEFRGNEAASPAATVIMFVGVLILLLALPSGWLADHFGKKTLVALSGLLAAGGIATALLMPGLVSLYIGGGLIGAGVGLFNPANWALGTEIVPPEQAGRFLGISNLAGAGAGAIGAYIGGPIADNYGYVLLFMIFGVFFFLSTIAVLGIREPEFRKKSA